VIDCRSRGKNEFADGFRVVSEPQMPTPAPPNELQYRRITALLQQESFAVSVFRSRIPSARKEWDACRKASPSPKPPQTGHAGLNRAAEQRQFSPLRPANRIFCNVMRDQWTPCGGRAGDEVSVRCGKGMLLNPFQPFARTL
jgi:hypothetical protein